MTRAVGEVPIWPESAYLCPIGKAPDGIRAFTHLATLKPPNAALCRGYVKHYPDNAAKGLFNEWFGYILMRALGVPQPQAAIMKAPVYGLPKSPMAWAFVSCQPTPTFDGTPNQLYNIDKPKQHAQLVKRLFNCTAMPLLIAADQFLINGDRNLGNLVFTGKSSFVAIDHGDILSGCNWAQGDLAYTSQWINSKLLEQLVPMDQIKPATRSAIFACAQLVTEAFYEAQLEIQKTMNYRESVDVSAALDAVWWRCAPIAQWFKERLELLA